MVAGIIIEILFVIVGVSFYFLPMFFHALGAIAIIIGAISGIIVCALPKSLEYRLSSIEATIISPGGNLLGKLIGFVLICVVLTFVFGGMMFLLFWADYYLISIIAKQNPYLYVIVIAAITIAPITLTTLFSRRPWGTKLKALSVFAAITIALLIVGCVFADKIPWDNVYEVPYKLYF